MRDSFIACLLFSGFLFAPILYSGELEEVVVSGQKASDSFKADAVSQSTLSDLWIQDLYIDSFEELSFFVPGLYVQEQSINSAGYAIRGMTSNNSEATRSPRVSVWQHGMDISRSQGAYTAMYDIARVDVYKGPVGSLFGHGGQIGGVNIINRFAQLDNSASLDLGIGSFNEKKISGHFNQIIQENNAFRIAIFKHERDGFIENSDGSDLNSVDTKASRLSLIHHVDGTEILIQANLENNTPSSPVFQSFEFSPDNPYENSNVSNAKNLVIDRSIKDIYGKINHEFNDAMETSFSVLYREVKTNDTFDPDGTILDLVEATERADFSTLEASFSLEFTDNAFSTSLGLDYMYEEVDVIFSAFINEQLAIRLPLIQQNPDVQALLAFFNTTIDHNLFDANGLPNPYTQLPFSSRRYEKQTESVENNSYAVFFDTTLFLTEKLSFMAGLRFSREELYTQIETPSFDSGGQNTLASSNLFLMPLDESTPLSSAGDEYSGISGRLSVTYRINQAVNFYSTYARGRRPDILNYTEQSVLEHLKDETVDSYEAGMHVYINDTYSTFDISAYSYKFKHFATQRSGVTALVVESDDDASAAVNGVETSYIQLFAKSYLLVANLTFNDAIFDESSIIEGENRFRYAPEWVGSLSISKDMLLTNEWNSRITLQDSFQTEVFFEDDNRSNQGKNRQGGYSLYNAYLDFIYTDAFTINLFIKNLTDKKYIVDAGNFGDLFGMPTFVPGMGRYCGFGLVYRF